MDPNIFKPYQVIEFNDSRLHIAESKGRRIFLFIFFRIYLILMAMAIIGALLVFELPVYYEAVLFIISAILLWSSQKKYITELILQKDKASVAYKTFSGEKAITVAISEIEKITIESYYFANGAGYQFRLYPKNNTKQIPLFVIPDYFRKVKNKTEIIEYLEMLTGLKVVKW